MLKTLRGLGKNARKNGFCRQGSLQKSHNLRNKIVLETAKCKYNSRKEPRGYIDFIGSSCGNWNVSQDSGKG